MQLAARRPHISAGVALASAAVIAAGPMTQHLPKFDVAQHLPQVSVTDINLTDAASSMMDLFSGVENELASLASGGASAAAVPANALSDIFSPITQNLVVQTWASIPPVAYADLQTIFGNWSAAPFPVAQQVAANAVQYASDYVGAYQSTATAFVNYFTGSKSTNFQPLIQAAINAFNAGKIGGNTGALYDLWEAIYQNPALNLLSMQNILKIPGYALQNLTNGYNFAVTGGLSDLISHSLVNGGPSSYVPLALGNSLQAALNAWNTGDTAGALTQLANVPGSVVQAGLVGIPPVNPNGTGFNGGLLSAPGTTRAMRANTGLLNELLNWVLPTLSQQIVAPGAQPIASGGSLATAVQSFGNQLINGWPSLTPVVNDLSAGLTQLLQNMPSILSNLPAMLGNIASSVGAAIVRLLALL